MRIHKLIIFTIVITIGIIFSSSCNQKRTIVNDVSSNTSSQVEIQQEDFTDSVEMPPKKTFRSTHPFLLTIIIITIVISIVIIIISLATLKKRAQSAGVGGALCAIIETLIDKIPRGYK